MSNVQLVEKLHNNLLMNTRVWNSYGSVETTVGFTLHLVNMIHNKGIIPIGRPLPIYRCLILDEFLQSIAIGQEGELLVGGVGVFAGYLGSDDLTRKVLIEVDGAIFYRTGDLVRLDTNGVLHYRGRKDHQANLRGQRIALDEIERCLLEHTTMAACVIIKWDNDHLVVYIQSSDFDEKQLRVHGQLYLPPNMIPSKFMMLEQLPLNGNGEIDRTLLPAPAFLSEMDVEAEDLSPLTSLGENLRSIFIKVFHSESPDVNMPFQQMGCRSLGILRGVCLIRQEIGVQIDVKLFYANPSIRRLARTIKPLLSLEDEESESCETLSLTNEKN